ncbi:MAG: type I-E CRISPR-associated protein Cse1/CasA [Pseudomonadales bacterium]|nr:type I-E CRISPR-associated protein Cse1/CasA [Pseudomonadales bacterium]
MTNLVASCWIPVRSSIGPHQITLQTLLTSKQTYHLSLPRDDMELSALQLLISLVQVIATPKDATVLRQRTTSPLTDEEFWRYVEDFNDCFVLDHAETPFMQVITPAAKNITPIQKLFTGLPAGNNHAFFNEVNEITAICGGCAAIALFNQASNAPGFSGKHKAGLRGGGKINTFISGKGLRETIWLNVLNSNVASTLLPDIKTDQLCWIEPIESGAKTPAATIGLARGLFWQPLRLKLESDQQAKDCDHCGYTTAIAYTGFWCEADFKFEVLDQWPHPHSPRCWDMKKEQREKERYLSLNQMTPGWTQLNQFALNAETLKQGSVRAPVIDQFESVFLDQTHDKMVLLVGGYANKQAAILERHHEIFSMPADWSTNKRWLEMGINAALEIKTVLRGRAYYFGTETGAKIHERAERSYYQQTESQVHTLLRSFSNRKEGRQTTEAFINCCKQLARTIFNDLSRPYQHSPAGLQQYAKDWRSLNTSLQKIQI